MILKICQVLKTDVDYRVASNSFTTKGVGSATAPHFMIDFNNTRESVSKAIIFALINNTAGKPHPKDFKESDSKYVSDMGFKTMAELHAKSALCIVQLYNNQLYFTPTKNLGRRRGFAHLDSFTEIIAFESSYSKIFETLNSAFVNCE